MSGGADERFLTESCKAYKECRVKNSARRNSLAKKTSVLEAAHRHTFSRLNREETLLRQQLQQMQLEKRRAETASANRGKAREKKSEQPAATVVLPPSLDVNPYPISFKSSHPHTPPPLPRDLSHTAPGRRGRRPSAEFEDLHLNTRTGKLMAKPGSRTKQL